MREVMRQVLGVMRVEKLQVGRPVLERAKVILFRGKEEKIVNGLKTVLGKKRIGLIGESLHPFRALIL